MVMAIAPRFGPPQTSGGVKIDPVLGDIVSSASLLPGIPAPMRLAGQIFGGLISSGALNPPPPLTTGPTVDPYGQPQGYSRTPVIPGINPMNYVVY